MQTNYCQHRIPLAPKLVRYVSIFMVIVASTGLCAQERSGGHREAIKTRVQFDRWKELLESKQEVRYEDLKLETSQVAPWQIKRVQSIGQADRGVMTQYLLTKSDQPQDTEILRVSMIRCTNRNDALEGLIDHLYGVQRPDVKLIEDKGLLLGDIAVHFPGKPESSIYFVRGNILVCVENAGQRSASELRPVAQRIDQALQRSAR
jgi:hypothetical protein